MTHDFRKAIYEYYGYSNDDAHLMERAVKIENLFSLIRENNVKGFQLAIDKDPQAIYAISNLRQTALHIACQYDRREILDFILTKLPKDIEAENRFINKRDYEGFTALMVCANENKPECAKMLMAHQPDLKIVGYDLKRNVAHLAAQKDASEILHLVLSAKTTDGKPILNANEPCKDRDGRGYTPVHFAASNFALDSMRVLSEFNPDINKKAFHKTPLMLALENGCQAVASYLLEQPQIDLTLQDYNGYLAYHYARHFRAPKAMKAQIKTMTEAQFQEKYPKIVSSKGIKAILSNEHVKS